MPRANQKRKVEIAAEAIESVFNDISVTQNQTRDDLLTLRERIDLLLESIPPMARPPFRRVTGK